MSSDHAGASGKRVLVLGGTSEIALAIVEALQRITPRDVALAGRDTAALGVCAEQLSSVGCDRVITTQLDALETGQHAAILADVAEQLGGIDIVILAVGALGERGGLPTDVPGAVNVLQTNLTGAGSLLMESARLLRERGAGKIVVLSSVAAERPRRANAVYGASKAGLDALAQGLGDELRDDGVGMLVVRPGFVHTRMTRGLDPAPLSTTPEAVADVVVAGLDSGADTVWAPSTLRWLMIIIKLLPRPIFRKMKQ